MRTLPLAAGLLLWAAALHGQNASTHDTTTLAWGPAPAAFPAGAKMAVVSGNPGEAGEFTVQLSMPNGYRIPPHFHPTDETVEVKQGSFLVGMGDSLNVSKTKTMKAGATGTIPAGDHHYGLARGKTVVSVTAMGPFAMTYVNPADDPQRPPQP